MNECRATFAKVGPETKTGDTWSLVNKYRRAAFDILYDYTKVNQEVHYPCKLRVRRIKKRMLLKFDLSSLCKLRSK